jgi:pantetheine-phosphate adenylyltransferase
MKTIASGTFDRIHRGHEHFLAAAFMVSDDVEIGLTSDLFASKKSHPVKPYRERKAALEEFLASKGWKARIREIGDIIGFALEPGFEAIVVSEETLPNAHLINMRRSELSLPALKIVTIPIIKNGNGEKISSGG